MASSQAVPYSLYTFTLQVHIFVKLNLMERAKACIFGLFFQKPRGSQAPQDPPPPSPGPCLCKEIYLLTSAITLRILLHSSKTSNSIPSTNAREITPISSQPTNSKASCDKIRNRIYNTLVYKIDGSTPCISAFQWIT